MAKRTAKVITPDIALKMKEIGLNVTKHRQAVGSNYKTFAELHKINNMTLWRIENGKDYEMSKFLQVIKAIGISPEDFFKDIK